MVSLLLAESDELVSPSPNLTKSPAKGRVGVGASLILIRHSLSLCTQHLSCLFSSESIPILVTPWVKLYVISHAAQADSCDRK